MRVTMLLADAAQEVLGKLYILGGGWSVTGPDVPPMALAIKLDVPWSDANASHEFELALVDPDGHAVRLADESEGSREVRIAGVQKIGPRLQIARILRRAFFHDTRVGGGHHEVRAGIPEEIRQQSLHRGRVFVELYNIVDDALDVLNG